MNLLNVFLIAIIACCFFNMISRKVTVKELCGYGFILFICINLLIWSALRIKQANLRDEQASLLVSRCKGMPVEYVGGLIFL